MANLYELMLRARIDDTTIRSQLQRISETQTIRINADGTRQATQNIQRIQDSLGNTITRTETLNRRTGEWGTTLRTVNTSAQRTSQTFGDIVTKVGKFLLATTVISGFTTAIYGAVDAVFEFDKTLIEFKKVSDLSGESLENYTNKLGEMGAELGRTKTEMLDSATLFKKSGFTEEQSGILAKNAEMFRNIADGQMSSADSSAFLIAQMKSFNITAEESMQILDMTNEVKRLPPNGYIG